MNTAIIAALITGAFSFLGIWVANSKQLAVIVERINVLQNKVEKHNQIVEKVYKMEVEVDHLKDNVDELYEK